MRGGGDKFHGTFDNAGLTKILLLKETDHGKYK
jgi:hypothetical protein